jgi:hypothetical protein
VAMAVLRNALRQVVLVLRGSHFAVPVADGVVIIRNGSYSIHPLTADDIERATMRLIPRRLEGVEELDGPAR